MNALRKIESNKCTSCDQDQKRHLYIIPLVVIIEIFLLLVAPLAYFVSLPPNPVIYETGSYPLTDAQIRESWPNLPTSQQIVDGGVYGFFDTRGLNVLPNSTANKIYYQSNPRWWDNASATYLIENHTGTNLPGSMGLIPIAYYIHLELHNSTVSNSTVWVSVPLNILNDTPNPPKIPKVNDNDFLGTSMPITYGFAAIAIISITIAMGATFLIRVRIKQQHNSES